MSGWYVAAAEGYVCSLFFVYQSIMTVVTPRWGPGFRAGGCD